MDNVIEIEIGILQPELRLELPATQDSLPIVRQALRAVGETVDAGREVLEDAELAVSEACANAVEHAYPDAGGTVEVTLSPRERELIVSVRDQGRGIEQSSGQPGGGRGFGLPMIHGIARHVDVSVDGGTEVEMAFELGVAGAETVNGAAPGVEPVERLLRRLVAVVAAQRDMPVDRMMEALLVVELVARHGVRRLVGDRARVRIEPGGDAVELRVGPLETSAADAVLRDSEVPVVGSVVERLADGVRVERERIGDVDCDYLIVRLAPRSGAAPS